MVKKCLVCGKEFKVRLSKVKMGHGIFCSKKCCSTWKSINKSGVNSSLCGKRWKAVGHKCKKCGKEFNVIPSQIKKGRGKFCSNKCYWEFRRTLRGSKSNIWRGGITQESKTMRTCTKYNKWKKKVFVIDNYTCQKCGLSDVKVNAHHIKRFSFILNDIKQKFPLLSVEFIADQYPILWDISNGITLCKKCHNKEHICGSH